MSERQPAFMFYPGDWLRHEVAGCSLAAQGLWLRMMIVMHDCSPYGHLIQNGLAMPDKAVAARCSTDAGTYRHLLSELKDAGVPSYTADGILFSSRLVKDERKRQKEREKKARQRQNGCPSLVPPDVPCLSPPSSSSLLSSLSLSEKEKEKTGAEEMPSPPKQALEILRERSRRRA